MQKTKKTVILLITTFILVITAIILAITLFKAVADDEENSNNIKFGYLSTGGESGKAGEITDITFSIKIVSDEPLESEEIKLYVDNEFVGTLNDNGENGDETAGDNKYSGTYSMYSDKRKRVNYYVSYKGIKSDEDSFFYSQPRTEEEQQAIDDMYSDVAEIKSKYIISQEEYVDNEELALYKTEQCYNEIMNYLGTRTDVENYGWCGFSIFVDFDFTITVGIPIDDIIETENKNISSSSARTISGYSLSSSSVNTSSLYKSKIITLQPYYDNLTTSVFDNSATNIVKENNYYSFIENLDNQQITVETMKTFSKYGIIILDSHGGNWEGYGYIIALSELSTYEKNAKYQDDINDYRVIDNGGYYVVTQKFFDYYYSEGDLDNTIIYLGSCHGGDTDVKIRKILNDKGAEAVLTYKNSVTTNYNQEMATTIFERLSKGDTVEEAVKEAKQKHGVHDPYISSDTYNDLNFWNKLLYNLGYIESANPAKLILTGNNTSFKLVTNPSTEQVTGTIIDALTNEPIANVKVTCNELNTYSITDKNGIFSLEVPLSLKWCSFTVEHDDYNGKSITTLNSNNYTLLNTVYLTPKTGTIIGYVKEQDTNTPLADVTVTAINGSIKRTVQTDKDGKFKLTLLPIGTWTLSFTKDTYYSDSTSTVHIREDLETILVNSYMRKRTKLLGTVKDSETSNPLSNVTIEAFDITNTLMIERIDGSYNYDDVKTGKLIATTTTDENGAFSLNLETGTYIIAVNKKNYIFYGEWVYVNNIYAEISMSDILLNLKSSVCITELEILDYTRYTGNVGDSCIFNLDGTGLQNNKGNYNAYGNVGVTGSVYENGLEVWIARWNTKAEISWVSATYKLDGKYSKLTGKIGLIKSYNTTNFNTTIYFYDGDTLLQSYTLTNDDYRKDIEVDVSNVDELKILVQDNAAVKGGTSLALYDMFLLT